MYMYVCIIYVHVCMHVCMYICMYMYVCMYVCMILTKVYLYNKDTTLHVYWTLGMAQSHHTWDNFATCKSCNIWYRYIVTTTLLQVLQAAVDVLMYCIISFST